MIAEDDDGGAAARRPSDDGSAPTPPRPRRGGAVTPPRPRRVTGNVDDALERVEMAASLLERDVDLVGSADQVALTLAVWSRALGAREPLRPVRRMAAARANATLFFEAHEPALVAWRAEIDAQAGHHPDVLLFHAASRLVRRRAAELEVKAGHQRLEPEGEEVAVDVGGECGIG